MAILRSSENQRRRMLAVVSNDGRHERYAAREDARAIQALASRLARPRYRDLEAPLDPALASVLVLVFDSPNASPVEVSIPPLDQAKPPALVWAPPETEEKRDMREQRRAANRAELAGLIERLGKQGFLVVGEGLDGDPEDDGTFDIYGRRILYNPETGKRAKPGEEGFEPVLDPEECALAAFRALVAGDPTGASAIVNGQPTRLRGDYGPLQTWAVVTVEGEGMDRQRVQRTYVGTEAALRRNFPDLDELERMRAAGILGAPTFNYHGPGGTLEKAGLLDGLEPDAVREALPNLSASLLEPAGHELPSHPVRIQRIRYDQAT